MQAALTLVWHGVSARRVPLYREVDATASIFDTMVDARTVSMQAAAIAKPKSLK
jgi:hypothetical protein